MKPERLSLRLSAEHAEILARVCATTGLTKTEVITIALSDAFTAGRFRPHPVGYDQ